VDGDRIIAADATNVAAPSHTSMPGNHLFVNCLYAPRIRIADSAEILCGAKADVVRIVKLLAERQHFANTRSVCITFLGRWLEGRGERIYRYSLSEDAYPTNARNVTESSLFSTPHKCEDSDIDDVRKLI
jgi:hypothetical protein